MDSFCNIWRAVRATSFDDCWSALFAGLHLYIERLSTSGSYTSLLSVKCFQTYPGCRVLMYLYRATVIPQFGAASASRPLESPVNPVTAACRTLSWVSTSHRLQQTAGVRTELPCDPSRSNPRGTDRASSDPVSSMKQGLFRSSLSNPTME